MEEELIVKENDLDPESSSLELVVVDDIKSNKNIEEYKGIWYNLLEKIVN